MMRIAQQHGNGQGEYKHDEGGCNVRSPSHPNVDKAIMFARHHIVYVTAIIFLLSQILETIHQNVVIAEKVFQ